MRVRALTREVSASLGRCELTHVPRMPIDVDRARAQHAAYEQALREMGCLVDTLPPHDDQPDAVFVEDTAVVLDELAIVTRPGAESRRGEVDGVARALQRHRPLVRIEAPATIDGGDVLAIGRSIFVGQTSRTNAEAVMQVRAAVAPFGYTVRPVVVTGCLHLKSAATALDDRTLLVNPAWVDPAALAPFESVAIDGDEPHAANAARVGRRLLYASAFPATRRILEARGFEVTAIDLSELAKAEGAVTCCSLLFGER